IINAQNLVPNPGFENFTTCPVGFSQFNGYVSNWVNPSAATPDYMNSCANPFPAGVLQNGTGYQTSHSGNAYAGFYTGADTYREYVQVQLTSPLVAGNNYTFKMFVVIHNKSKTATDDIGAYFSDTAPASAGSAFLNGNPVAQVSNTSGNVIVDSANWTLISGNFTASGGEQYLTIGHFKTDAASTYQTINYGGQGAYYYIDDVSLIGGTPLPVELLSFTATLQKNNSSQKEVLVKWITASEKNNCCFEIERSEDGIAFHAIGKTEGTKNSTSFKEYNFTDSKPLAGVNYYRLKQFDLNNDIEYSKIVAVRNDNKSFSILFIKDDNHFGIYVFNAMNEKSALKIFDIAGRLVFEKEDFSVNKNEEINISFLKKGIYFLKMQDNAENIFSEKFVR
ncbi:MAG: T9SS type A sorting domain-containing protein, partial [Bacteroidota bacterium]